MIFISKFFDELTARELYEIVRARQEIFLMEQNIVCRDFDGVDYDALHCFLWQDGKVLAYLRAYRGNDGEVHIGRVLTIPHGEGLGRSLMEFAMPRIVQHFGCERLTLHSQCHAEGFYKKLGFVRMGDVFLEEGIEHVKMRANVKTIDNRFS
jgi:ElaA protein